MSQVRKMQQGGKVRKNGRELTGQAAYDWLQQNLAGVGNGETHTIAEKALNDGNTFDINADGSWYIRDAQGNDVSSNYVGDSFAKASDSRFKKVLGATFNSKNHNNRLESDALAKATIVDPVAAAAASQANTKTALRRGSGWFNWDNNGQWSNDLNNNTAFSILDNIGKALNAENFDGYDLTGWNEQSLNDAKEYLRGNPEWLNQLKDRIQRNDIKDDDKQLLNAFGFVEPEKTAEEQAIADQQLYNQKAGDAYLNGNNQGLDGIMGVIDDGQGNQTFGLADPDALRQALGLKPGQNAFFGDYFKLAGYDHLKNKYLIGNKIYDPANEADRNFIETFINNSKFAELNEKGNYGASDGIIKWNWEDSVRPWATGSAAQYISPWQADKLYEGVNWANASTTYKGQALQPGQQIVRYAANNTQRDINGFVRPEDIKYAIIDDKGFKIADGLNEEAFENLGEGKDDEGNIIGINFEKRLTNDRKSPYYDKYKEEIKSGNPDDPVAMTAIRSLDGSGDVEVRLSDALMPQSLQTNGKAAALVIDNDTYEALKAVVKSLGDNADADAQERLKDLIGSLYQSRGGAFLGLPRMFTNAGQNTAVRAYPFFDKSKSAQTKRILTQNGAPAEAVDKLIAFFDAGFSKNKEERERARNAATVIPGEILSNKQGGEIPSMQMGGIAINTGITTGNHSVIKKAESKNDYRKFGVMGDGDHGADMSSGDRLERAAFLADLAALVASFTGPVGSGVALAAGLTSMGLDMAARKRKGEKMSGKSIATGLALAAASVIPGAKAGKIMQTAAKYTAAGLMTPGAFQAVKNLLNGKGTAEDLHAVGLWTNTMKAGLDQRKYNKDMKKLDELTKNTKSGTAVEAAEGLNKKVTLDIGEGKTVEANLDADIIRKVKDGSLNGKTPAEVETMLREKLVSDLKTAGADEKAIAAANIHKDGDLIRLAGLEENFGKTMGLGKVKAKADAKPGFVSKTIDKVKNTSVFKGPVAAEERAAEALNKSDRTVNEVLDAYKKGKISKWTLGRFIEGHPELQEKFAMEINDKALFGWKDNRYSFNKQKYSSPTISEEKVDAGKAVVKTASETAPAAEVVETKVTPVAQTPEPLMIESGREPMALIVRTKPAPKQMQISGAQEPSEVIYMPNTASGKTIALPSSMEEAAAARKAARKANIADWRDFYGAWKRQVQGADHPHFVKQGGVIKAQSGVQVPKLPDLTADIDAGVNTSVNAAYNRTMNMLEKLPTINTQKAPSIVAPSRMKNPSTITRKRGANGGGSENGLQVDPVAYLDWKHMKDQNRAADEYGNIMEKTINDSVVQTPYTRLQRMRSGLTQMANNTNMAIAGMRSQAGINESADDRLNTAQNLATEGQIAQARLGEAQQASAQYNQEQAQNSQIANQEMQMNAQNYANNAQRRAQARAAIGELKVGVFQKKRDNEHAWKQLNLSRLKQLRDITAEADAKLALYNDMTAKQNALTDAIQARTDAYNAYKTANPTNPLDINAWSRGEGAKYQSAINKAQADADSLNITAERDAALNKMKIGNAYGWLVRSKKGGKMRDPINDMAVNAHKANLKASELLDKEVLKLISQLVK